MNNIDQKDITSLVAKIKTTMKSRWTREIKGKFIEENKIKDEIEI